MAGETTKIAFFGSMTLLAREIRAALEARDFPAADVRLYDPREDGAVTEFAGEALLVTVPDEESIVDLDVAFMCGSASETAPYLDWAARRHYVAIDLSGASRGRPGVPLVHCEINPADISGGAAGQAAPLIGSPHPVSHNLASLVACARTVTPVREVEALALRPVSDLGEQGIDELYRQTVALLNFAPVPQEVFGRQMAFNILPSSGAGAGGAEGFDERVHEETIRLLGLRPEQASITTALVPMFHGHAIAVGLTFEKPPEMGALKETFRTTRGLKLVEEPGGSSPVENAGEEAVAVLDLRADAHRAGRVNLWSFCDNLKGGAALNAVRIAQRVIDLRRRN